MTPFQRLILCSAAFLVAGAVAGVAIFLSFWVGLIAVLGGVVLAVLCTLEFSPGPSPLEEAVERAEAVREAPITETHRKITERRAERAREQEAVGE